MATIIRGPVTTLVEDYLSVNTSEVIPADQHRWYRNVPGTDTQKITLLIGDGVKTIASLPRYLSSSELQLIPGDPSLVKDWVEKFLAETTPPATLVNSWGQGIYYLGISYMFNGAPGRATMTLFVNPGDGFNRYALASMDFTGADSFIGCMYDQADNSFKPMGAGTDYTDLSVYALYRWESLSTAELSPPVDGWETVYDNPTGASAVLNTWGEGTFEFTLIGVPGVDNKLVANMTVTEDDITSGTGTVSTPASDTHTLVRYTASGNTFTRIGTSGSITRIRKFNGMLNVVHTVQNTGVGVPAGGATGDSLRKNSPSDYDTKWVEDRLTANRTVTIPGGSTSAQIQALINAQPRNLNGYSLTFQFADGDYTLTSSISVYHTGGTVAFVGNAADNTAAADKSVTINLSAGINISVNYNSYTYFQYIEFRRTAEDTGNMVRFIHITSPYIEYCSFHGFSPTSRGVEFRQGGYGICRNNYFNLFDIPIYVYRASVHVSSCPAYNSTRLWNDSGFITYDVGVPSPTNYDQSGQGVISIPAGIFNVDFPFASPPS